MKHTKEPWYIEGYEIPSKDSLPVVIGGVLGSTAQANAYRIVSCVNALEGLNPEGIKELIEITRMILRQLEACGYGGSNVATENKHIKRLQSALEKVKA